VFSFEEMLHHVFHNWRDTADEFLTEASISWVADLGLSYIATRMKELVNTDPFNLRIMGFLRLANYFGEDELHGLQTILEKWEQRREWEKLKERADLFARRSEPEKAIPLYKRALQFEENAPLLNNLGVMHLQANEPKEGLSYLTRALSLEPNNLEILLHYIEAAIMNASFDKAAKALRRAHQAAPKRAEISYLLGLMAYEQKDFPAALPYLEKAIEIDGVTAFYTFKAVDLHLQMRQYEQALAALQRLETKDPAYHEKEAEIYAAWGDIPRAVKSMQNAISATKDPTATAFAKLAAYHRQDYDPAAKSAIEKALALSPENNIVRLENDSIQKSLGNTRAHQAVLNEILSGFKNGYRTTS
jgi:tetratricopeptide (TPR) repeat protein